MSSIIYNSQLKSLMELEKTGAVEQFVYKKTYLVHNFTLSGHFIAFDLVISPTGWELQLFGRNNNSRSYLSKLLDTPPMNQHKTDSMKDSRHILQHYDLKADLDEIKTGLLRWFHLLLESEKNRNATEAINSDS